jgi:site-specific DNA recombinase
MRVATYTRISTDEDHQPFSLGAQEERLETYARSQDGWRIVRRFSDQASGATLDRTGLQQVLAEAHAGVYELLLVFRVDRLSRNVRQLVQLSEELDRVNVALRSATEPFDTSSAAGKMMLQMLGVFAEFERTTIVERVIAGMERAASQGRWVMGKVPYGYVRDDASKLLVAEPVQGVVVRRIFELYVTGRKGIKSIANILNAEGLRTKNGMPFAHPIVHSILCNPIYAGRVRFRGKEFSGLHEALVDEDAYERVQALMAERSESHALRRGNPSDYILSGVVRCGLCGRVFIGTSAKGRSALYHYYTCSTRYRYGTKECAADRLPKGALEEAVIEQMVDVYADGEPIAEALAEATVAEGKNREETEERIASVRQQQAGARRALDRYFAAFEEGSLSPSDCQERIGMLKARIESLEAEERQLAQEPVCDPLEPINAAEVAQWAECLPDLLTAGSAQQRKALLRSLIKEIHVMGREEIVPTYRIPPLVRAVSGSVDPTGIEPVTSAMPWRHSTK